VGVAKIRNKGQITLPAEVRTAANLEDGDVVEVEVTANGDVLLRPKKLIPASQAWFWTESWQQGEREASKERDSGRGETFRSDEEFLNSLQAGRKR
jgi:AbrB family looped-hinge helix DNA binding protein